jgi:hypothetical protein
VAARSRVAGDTRRDSRPRAVDIRQLPPLLWIDRAGQMAALALRCAVELVTPGPSWRREAIVQCANVFWLAIVPVLLINFLVGFAGAGISGGSALEYVNPGGLAGTNLPCTSALGLCVNPYPPPGDASKPQPYKLGSYPRLVPYFPR